MLRGVYAELVEALSMTFINLEVTLHYTNASLKPAVPSPAAM